MRKNIKCRKCDTYFKDRQDKEEKEATKILCWPCKFIWDSLGAFLEGLGEFMRSKGWKRNVLLDIEDVYILKKRNHP